jgi:peptidoglycan/xylan/chitin deacetylase (PgdA/CDA1 family)
MGAAHLAARAIGALSRRTIGLDFANLMALGCRVITKFSDPRAVYLTFDDSPNPSSTLDILAALDRQRIRATFFCIGSRVLQHPDLVKHILAAGHEIGNHSMHHPNLWRVSPWRLRNEIKSCQNALQSTWPKPLKVNSFRAPYGNFRWDLRLVKAGPKHFIKWDVAPSCEKPDANTMAECVLKNTRPGSIIALHDGLEGMPQHHSDAAGKATVDCIPMIVPLLKARGLHFKVISEGITSSL